MKYNVRKENYEKRVLDLKEYAKNNGMINEKDPNYIVWTEEMQENPEMVLDEINNMIAHIYFDGIDFFDFPDIFEDEEQLYYDWYMNNTDLGGSFTSFITECDGFLSHLRVREILEIISNISNENEFVLEYVNNNNNFKKLKENYEEIMKEFANEDFNYNENSPSWSEPYFNWEYLEIHYGSLRKSLEEFSNDISNFKGCQELSVEIKELKECIIPMIK